MWKSLPHAIVLKCGFKRTCGEFSLSFLTLIGSFFVVVLNDIDIQYYVYKTEEYNFKNEGNILTKTQSP